MYILDLFFKGPFWKPLLSDWRPPLKILIIYVIFLFIFYWSQHVMWLNMPKLVILNLGNIWVIFSNIQNCDVENNWRIINSIASIRCESMLQSYLSLDVICSKERRVWKNCELWQCWRTSIPACAKWSMFIYSYYTHCFHNLYIEQVLWQWVFNSQKTKNHWT